MLPAFCDPTGEQDQCLELASKSHAINARLLRNERRSGPAAGIVIALLHRPAITSFLANFMDSSPRNYFMAFNVPYFFSTYSADMLNLSTSAERCAC